MAQDEIWLAASQRMVTGLKQFGSEDFKFKWCNILLWHKLGAFLANRLYTYSAICLEEVNRLAAI